MAEKVASLYAEISADTSKLQSGLNSVKPSIQNTGKQIGGLQTGLINFNMAMTAANTVVNAAKQIYDQTAGATLAYASQVRDLNRVTGTGAEETSRLIQVADDLTISYQSLEQAAKIAAKNGIEFTTESLAALSEEYLALNPGQERAAFLIEKFGKNGLEMGKMLEKGTDEINKMSAAIDDNMIMTEEAVSAARDFEIAQDNLADAVQGAKYAIGNALIPVITEAVNAINLLINAEKELKNVLSDHEEDVRNTANSYEEYITDMITAGLAAKQFEGAEVNLAKAFLDGTLEVEKRDAVLFMLANSIDALTAAEFANIGIIEANKDANQQWMDALDDGATRVGAFGAALSEDLAPTLSDIKSMMQELTAEFIFNQAAANLDGDSALALAGAMGLIDPATQDAIEAINTLSDKYDANRDGAISAAEAANGYTASISGYAEAALMAADRDPYEAMTAGSDAAYAGLKLIKDTIDEIPATLDVLINVDGNIDPQLENVLQSANYNPNLSNTQPVNQAFASGGYIPAGAQGIVGNEVVTSMPNGGAVVNNSHTYNIQMGVQANENAVINRLRILEAFGI